MLEVLKPCRKCGSTERYVNTGKCVSCRKAAKRRYNASDKGRASSRACNVRYYHANKEREAERRRRYVAANPDKVATWNKNWDEANPERRRELTRTSAARYRATNPGKKNALSRRRRISKLRRTPTWADLSRIRSIYERAAQMTRETGVRMHVDHVVPLQGEKVSGLHVHENLRIIPAIDNSLKGNRFEVAA